MTPVGRMKKNTVAYINELDLLVTIAIIINTNTNLGKINCDDRAVSLFLRAGSEQMDEFLGAEMVNLRLLALTREERLLLSPNLEAHGLRALASPHGLVLVAVAGTIHRDEACLGIFEQIFGLIRSPLENNSWKIKFVNLKIRGQDALGGTEVAAPALSYNSTELQLLCS